MVHVAAKPTSTASSHPIKLAKLKLRESGYIYADIAKTSL